MTATARAESIQGQDWKSFFQISYVGAGNQELGPIPAILSVKTQGTGSNVERHG